MNHRAVVQGIVIAAIAYLASIGLLRVHDYIGTFLYELSAYSGFFWGPFEKIIINLYWFAPGIIIGFKTDHAPVKSAAITGLWIGFFLSIYGMSGSNLETHDSMMVAAYIYRTICVMAEISFLFTLASSFGHILSIQRKLLTTGSKPLASLTRDGLKPAP